MKRILGVILLLEVFVAAQWVTYGQEKKADPKQKTETTVNKDEIIARISKYREEGEQKLVGNKQIPGALSARCEHKQ
jgi:hypothetical protein